MPRGQGPTPTYSYLTNRVHSLATISFAHCGIDFEYDRDYPYEGCECSDICRCSIIVDQRIISIDTELMAKTWISEHSLASWIREDPLTCQKVKTIFDQFDLEATDFEIEVDGGYYGEEIKGVYLDSSKGKAIQEKLEDLAFELRANIGTH